MQRAYYTNKLKYIVLYLLPVFYPLDGLPQLNRYEVLFSEYPKANIDSNTIKQKIVRAQEIQDSNADSARIWLLQAYRESEQIQFPNGILLSLHALGMCYQKKGFYDTAIYYFKRAEQQALSSGITHQLHKVYINIGSSYFYRSQYQKTLHYYYKTLDAIRENGIKAPPYDSFAIYSNIALVWQRLGNMEEATRNLKIAGIEAERSNNPEVLGAYYGYYGAIYANNPQKVLPYYHKALQLKTRPENRLSTLNSMAHLYIDLKNADSAWYYIQEAKALIRQFPDLRQYDQLHSRDNLGHYYFLLKQYSKAQKMLLEVYEEAASTDATDLLIHISPNLSDAFEATGDYRNAYHYAKNYIKLKDGIYEKQKTQSLNDWLELRNKEKNQLVEQQRLRISLQQSQLQSRALWIAIILACLLLCTVVFIMLYRAYKQKNMLQSTTIRNMEQEQEIMQLKALVRGEEQERKRIGKELHDGIASELWAIKMNVASMQGQVENGHVQQQDLEVVHQQLINAAREIRNTAHNLIPDLLENGLPEALRALCKKVSYQTKLEIDFQQYGQVPRLNHDIELSLYRMIQELIQNCLKHANGATYLLVQISCTDYLLNITVEDNGTGFENYEQRIKDGDLLHTVQQRIHTLKGVLDIQSMEGKGSTIYLEFDIHNLL